MLDPRFVILASIIDLSGILAYARDTLKGDTQPNRVTWFLWTIVPFITFLAQFTQGVGWPALLTLVAATGPGFVLLASFLNKKAYWQISKFDLVCGALSVVAVVLWLVAKNGSTAIVFSITADFIASLPTVIKAYRYPLTESANAYLAGIFSTIITLFTIRHWNFSTYSFTIYLLALCITFFVLIKFPKARIKQ